MLNLSQRLILGCALLAGLVLSLVILAHRALAASGLARIAFVFAAAAILIAVATVLSVQQPIRILARTRGIAIDRGRIRAGGGTRGPLP